MLKPRKKEKASQKMLANASDKVNYGPNVFKGQVGVKGYILQVNVKNYQLTMERKLNLAKAMPLSVFMQWQKS